GDEALEVSRERGRAGGEPREEDVELVVRVLRDARRRERREIHDAALHAREPQVAALEDVEDGAALEVRARSAQVLLEPEERRGRLEEGAAQLAVERRVPAPRADDDAGLDVEVGAAHPEAGGEIAV